MAPKLIQTPEVSFSRPSVNPAITLWNDNDATTKAVRNKDLVLSAFFSSCRNALFSSLSEKQKIYISIILHSSIYWLVFRSAHLVTKTNPKSYEIFSPIILSWKRKQILYSSKRALFLSWKNKRTQFGEKNGGIRDSYFLLDVLRDRDAVRFSNPGGQAVMRWK